MTLKEFIQQSVLTPRLQQASILVVYDPDCRYKDLCLGMATDHRLVVDASETSIESRENALSALQELGRPNTALQELLIYVPADCPDTEKDQQRDPFSLFTTCGARFPEGDGDEYLSLCLKAKPDYATEVRRIFAENPNPSFDVIDAIGAGGGWPTLQASLRVESARDILFALLSPSDVQLENLREHEAWVVEAKSLFRASIGLSLKTRSKNWSPIADELWRFLLFSEFVFDLPEPIPSALSDVPHADEDAQLLVEDLCDRLRNDRRTQALYIERAEKVEEALSLPATCANIQDLGIRDTFAFEERSFFAKSIAALKNDDIDLAKDVIERHAHSVWVGKGESQAKWILVQAALELIQVCQDVEQLLPENSRKPEDLIDFYIRKMREVDRRHRELEQARGGFLDFRGDLDEVTSIAQKAYRRIVNEVQEIFLRQVQEIGWPISDGVANVDAFDKFVSPMLQESGHRVAIFLIDAMRYELGVELQKELSEDVQAQSRPVFAQIPTITPMGMASLLPGAGRDLKLLLDDGKAIPNLADQPVSNVTQRMEYMRARYGQRFAETPLKDFLQGEIMLEDSVDLLVIRSNEMDRDFEMNPDIAPGLITNTFNQVRGAVHRLRNLGFQDAFIFTDHGFFMNTGVEAGDVCSKPPGNWIILHDRILLGDGSEDGSNLVMPAESLGIHGDFNQVAVPRAMVAYSAGYKYFHGGISLQEAIVPIIELKLTPIEEKVAKPPTVRLNYRQGEKKITTLIPVVEMEVSPGDLFSMESSIDILLEAYDDKGNVVGQAKPGGPVNPATLTISVLPGRTDPLPIMINMDLEFEGKFTLKALDPTTLATYHSLELETDYLI
jgi:hypothetical protein